MALQGISKRELKDVFEGEPGRTVILQPGNLKKRIESPSPYTGPTAPPSTNLKKRIESISTPSAGILFHGHVNLKKRIERCPLDTTPLSQL